jgi:hypothetical protein
VNVYVRSVGSRTVSPAQWEGSGVSSYTLAQLRLKYGSANLARYDAAMVAVRAFFESQGVMLVAGTVTRVGPLYEAWNLWEIEDQGHIERALRAVPLDIPEALGAMAELNATVEHEQARFLESLAFTGSPNTD